MADLAGDVRLQSAREDLVYDAVAVVGVVGLLPVVITFAVPVQDVQRRDEEFVGVLLLVPRQVPGVSPHQVQQLVWDVGGPVPRVKLLKKRGHLAHQTRAGALHFTPVPVGEEEVPQERRVGESLDDAVHEARVSKVDQPPQTYGAVRGDLSPFRVVFQQFKLPFGWFPS